MYIIFYILYMLLFYLPISEEQEGTACYASLILAFAFAALPKGEAFFMPLVKKSCFLRISPLIFGHFGSNLSNPETLIVS